MTIAIDDAARREQSIALNRRDRWRPLEVVYWGAAALCFFVFPDSLLLFTQAMILGLFALSLDVLLGYAGIASLGHAVFFGIGAYSSALALRAGWTEPLTNLMIGAAAAAAAGLIIGMVVSRLTAIAQLVVTLSVGVLLYDLATQFPRYSGGEDGIRDLVPADVLGRFSWDLEGRTAYIYVFFLVGVMYLVARRIVNSPLGLSLQGLRENAKRMPALGVPIRRKVAVAFAISAALAGIAGAPTAQTSEFVGLNVLSLERSFSVLIMLAIGGTGTLIGAMIGAAVYVVASDQLATVSPVYWNFWLGLILIALVTSGTGGVATLLNRGGRAIVARLTRR